MQTQKAVPAQNHILVVDDEPLRLRATSRVLKRAGFTVTEAVTGFQGLELAQQIRPDLVLLDVVLPDISGLEVGHKIKTEPTTSNLYVVMFSNIKIKANDRIAGLEQGADDYIVRPISNEELLTKVKTYLRTINSENALRASESRLRLVIEKNADGMIIVDKDGIVRFVNPAAAAIFGRSREVLTGTEFGFPIGDDTPTEISIIQADGTPVIAEMRVVEMEWDDDIVHLASMRDITQRKQVEESEHNLRALAEALSEIAIALSRPLDLNHLGEVILDQVQRVVAYDCAFLIRADDNGYTPIVMRQATVESPPTVAITQLPPSLSALVQQAIMADQAVFAPHLTIQDQAGYWPERNSCMAVPLFIRGRVVGVIMLTHHTPGYYDATTGDKLSAFANHASVAFEKTDLFERLRQLAQQLVLIQEEERRHVAHELHDVVGQSLTALNISLNLLLDDLCDDVHLHERVSRIIQLARATADQVRSMSYGLRPPLIDTLGLDSALQDLCDTFASHTEITINYRGQDVAGLTEAIQISLYRILQESLNNVAKHARATRIEVTFSASDTAVCLEIQDNGQGFDIKQSAMYTHHGGLGLIGMQERVAILDGKIDIESEPGMGTVVRVMVPVTEG
jgi:signal transduction histidine kinase/FixJ family two-component response regulator